MTESLEPRILGGNGDSEETRVVFARCFVADRVRAEYDFICDRFGPENVGWFRGMHFTLVNRISQWSIDLSDGTPRSIYFDTSNTIYPTNNT